MPATPEWVWGPWSRHSDDIRDMWWWHLMLGTCDYDLWCQVSMTSCDDLPDMLWCLWRIITDEMMHGCHDTWCVMTRDLWRVTEWWRGPGTDWWGSRGSTFTISRQGINSNLSRFISLPSQCSLMLPWRFGGDLNLPDSIQISQLLFLFNWSDQHVHQRQLWWGKCLDENYGHWWPGGKEEKGCG